MKLMKKIVVWLLTVSMLASVLPIGVFAADTDEYSITNGYLTYTFNGKTGGFSIETAEGHPQKALDNDIPLLYKEDKTRSNGTSFTSVRIDGKDYVFGQDYGFFGMASELKTPVVSEEGRLITIEWTIHDITIIKRVALGTDVNSDITGNTGISYEVKNNSGEAHDVGIRLLLDTALGNSIDAPYVVVDEAITPTFVETEFTGEDVPAQIRNVDSLSNPKVMSYLITKGWEGGIEPNKIIVGHWANMANTRYDYVPDEYCDFTNYSNLHKEPDAATAVYWEKQALAAGESFKGETLYGVGNFSSNTLGENVGLNITTGRVELDATGKAYKNNGEITVNVEIDNTLDNSNPLSAVMLNLTFDENDYEAVTSTQATYTEIGNEIKYLEFKLRAKPQDEITAGGIYISLTGTENLPDGTQRTIENMTERSVILPSVTNAKASIQMTTANPKIVWTGGEKAITVTGNMKEFEALNANQGWDLRLKHTTSDHSVLIAKSDISFLDENYETMSFRTGEELEVGYYEIVFEFTDTTLVDAFGKSITATANVQVSADEKYKQKSYGIISLIRTTDNNSSSYDFYSFANEGEYNSFYNGYSTKIGMLTNTKIKHNFGENVDATGEHEILITVRGYLREAEREVDKKTEKYWQAEYGDGDIIINNILSYEGDKPLELYRDKDTFIIKGDGLLKVVNSVNVWRSEWSINVQNGIHYTLDPGRVGGYIPGGENAAKRVTLSLDGAAMMIQSLGGFLIDMKFGEFSSEWWDGGDGRVTYGIGFGGSIGIPIKEAKNQKASSSSSTGGTGGTGTGTGGTGTGSGSGTSGTTTSTPAPSSSDPATSTDPGNAILTNDQEDISDAMHGLFGDPDDDDTSGSQSGSSGSGAGSGGGSGTGSESGSGSGTTTPPSGGTTPSTGNTSTPSASGSSGTTAAGAGTSTSTSQKGSLKRQNTGMTDGTISAEVRNVLFGEDAELQNGEVVVNDTGFLGIDTTVKFGLPQDVFGKLISNAPGLMVNMTINTIDNVYEFNAGINIKIIECEGLIAFKEVNVKNKDTIVPDKIEFHVRQGLAIPVGPPATPVYITGLGGGINDLADTIGGNFTELPPITILLSVRLEVIKLLQGNLGARVNLEGLSLEGNLTINNLKDLLNIEAMFSARWIDPWSINLYGQVNVIDGLIKGGLTVTIADNYFYGYIYAGICIPDSIPVVGGKELAGVEAAVSHEFIGANIKIIGIKYGVIYYWGENVTFKKNLDLSAPAGQAYALRRMSPAAIEVPDEENGMISYYGTNVHPLEVKMMSSSSQAPMMLMSANAVYKEATAQVYNAEDQDALLFEIPFTGTGSPKADEIILVNPDGVEITMVPDDGKGNGNFLVQDRVEHGRYMYITVTDSDLIKSGEWTVKYSTENITLNTIKINGVDNVPEIASTSVSYNESDRFKADVSWTVNDDSNETGMIDVYLTKDKDVLNKIKTSNNTSASLGDNMLHLDDAKLTDGNAAITIPDSYESGTYYVVTMLSSSNGATCAISDTPITFTNPNLPKAVQSVKAIYGGNGNIYVKIEDAENPDYTDYLVEVKAADGTTLDNNFNQYAIGDDLIFIGKEAQLIPGKDYYVNVRTLREENVQPEAGSTDGAELKFYYGADVVSSNTLTMPEISKPKLLKVETNFDTSKEFISEDNIEITYTFDRPVWVEMDSRGQKQYSDDDFKEIWTFELENLEDGDYVVDFKAYSKSKDYVTGADFVATIPDAQLGFTIDTSAPTLTLAQKHFDSLEEDASGEAITATFGTNVVIAEDDGTYIIEGLTEKSANLTVDGKTDGITIDEGGVFTYKGKLPEGSSYIQHTLKAVDKSENASELMVTVLSGESSALARIVILANGEEIEKDANGEKNFTLRNLESVKFTAVGETTDGKRVPIDNDAIDFSVLYEKSIITLADGTVQAVSTGETAVKAKLGTSTIETAEGKLLAAGLEDYVVLTVEDNTKNDLETAITNAESTLAANSNKASTGAKNALQAAIDAAQAVLDNPTATETEITEAVTALNQAVSVFTDSLSSGSSGGGGGSTYYSVEAVAGENGTVTLSHKSARRGTSVTVTAVPNEGYEVADMIINGVSVGNVSVYTIKSVSADTTVQVTFRKIGEKAAWNPFIDVKSADWFHDDVKYAYENNLMVGVSASMFEPNGPVTRAMLVTVLYRNEGEPEITDVSSFADVETGSWYDEAVSWAQANGIVKGYSETEFRPNEPITREQIAAIMHRYANFKGYDVSVGENTNILSYDDFDDISEWAIADMQYAVGSGLIKGKSESTLNPLDNATRAEIAAILHRFIEANK